MKHNQPDEDDKGPEPGAEGGEGAAPATASATQHEASRVAVRIAEYEGYHPSLVAARIDGTSAAYAYRAS
eukprot:3924454-Prymnesium_polylepis.1